MTQNRRSVNCEGRKAVLPAAVLALKPIPTAAIG